MYCTMNCVKCCAKYINAGPWEYGQCPDKPGEAIIRVIDGAYPLRILESLVVEWLGGDEGRVR